MAPALLLARRVIGEDQVAMGAPPPDIPAVLPIG